MQRLVWGRLCWFISCLVCQEEPVTESVENGANVYEVEPVPAEPTYEEPVQEDLYQNTEPDDQTSGAANTSPQQNDKAIHFLQN